MLIFIANRDWACLFCLLPKVCLVNELWKPITYLSLKSLNNEYPSNQFLSCSNIPLNGFSEPVNTLQAFVLLRNNSLFLKPAISLDKCWGDCSWYNLPSMFSLITKQHYLGTAQWLLSSVSQDSGELLLHAWTVITLYVLLELFSPSTFGILPGRVCVYVSRTDSKHHSGV